MKLYGAPLSQPFRSVAWTLLQLEIPFEVQLAVPGAKTKIGTRHENFTQLTPYKSTFVPLLVHDNEQGQPVALSESAAIMMHLCELSSLANRNDPTTATARPALYPPPGTIAKAKVDAYLHWHHSNTRLLSRVFASKVRSDLQISSAAVEKVWPRIHAVLQTLDTGWLENNNVDDSNNDNSGYLTGLPYPTIADILAYGELANLTMTNLLALDSDEADAPSYRHLKAWMKQMAQQPYHEEVHRSLVTLGDLNDTASTPLPLEKRLGAATKAGLMGLQEAQAKYSASSSSSTTIPSAKL